MAEYSVKGLLVGPFLPKETINLDEVYIRSGTQQRWETLSNPVSALADEGDSQITFTPNVATLTTPATLEHKCNASSSMEADKIARQKFERVSDVLNIGCIENTYFFRITDIERLSDGTDPESQMSEPIRIVNYEYRLLDLSLESYAKAILSIDDNNAKKIINAFGKALRDSNLLELYKVMEMITHILRDEVRAKIDVQEIAQKELKEIESLRKTLEASVLNEVKKSAIKEASEELRRLNLEQIGKRISATAEYLGLTGEVITVINRAIRYRNKVMAHSDSVSTSLANSGPKDIQESARFFVIRYLDKKFNIKLPNTENVTYSDQWYRISYANSVATKTSGTPKA